MNFAVEILVWMLGLCVGSFLNVVIYRLPLGLSISSPRWSFCPSCKQTLQWYDNLPLVGWLMLRARCRSCQMPIGLQYPVVEAITGLVFLAVYRLLFVEQARAWDGILAFPVDWAVLVAWLVLAAALIACAGMDIASYMVDTGVTNFAVLAGIVLLALAPASAETRAIAAHPLAAACCATFVVSVFMLWWTLWRVPHLVEATPDGQIADADQRREERSPDRRTAWGTGTGVVVGLVALSAWLLFAPVGHAVNAAMPQDTIDPVAVFSSAIQQSGWPIPCALAGVFLVMVLSAGRHRVADEELHEAIEEEAPQARRAALQEIGWLLPGIVAGGIAYLLAAFPATGAAIWAKAAHAPFLPGAIYAIHGAIVAAAAGWMVRIFFTLAFGKEAFGVGDIYILAAAGACGGWDIALLGFGFSIGVALLGFVIGMAMKRTSLIAFGPPLALGFLFALWLNRPAAMVAGAFWADASAIWERQPWLLSGVLGGSVVLALVLARLTRWLLERGSASEP